MSDELSEYALASIANPRWAEATKVHDWRNHVPEEVQDLWPTFSEAQKRALYRWADNLASNEEWE